LVSNGLLAKAKASACSRPPEPMRRTFIELPFMLERLVASERNRIKRNDLDVHHAGI
jgi:hypothetical protein